MTTATSETDSSRRSLRLTIVTPLQVVLDLDGVRHVRAEDATGSFGILPGHADFLTVLTVAVLMYRTGDGVDPDGRDGAVTGVEHFVGLRGGTLFVTHGRHVQVFAREAIPSDDLQALSVEVKQRLTVAATQEAEAHKRFARLEGAMLSHLTDFLRHEHRSGTGGPRRPVIQP